MALKIHSSLDINKVLIKGFTCHDVLQTVGEFKRKLLKTDGIPVNPDDFYVTENGRIVKEDQLINSNVVYRVHSRLLGGKGGFGSMLRSLGAQMSKKTTNKNSCRDLSGRRIKEVKNEKLLREWLENEPERERLKREKEDEKKKKKEMKNKESKFFFDSTAYDKQREKIMEDQEQLFRQKGLVDFGKSKPMKNNIDPAKAKKWFGNFNSDSDDDDSDDDDSDDDDEMVQKAKKPKLELGSQSGSCSTNMDNVTPQTGDDVDHSRNDDDDYGGNDNGDDNEGGSDNLVTKHGGDEMTNDDGDVKSVGNLEEEDDAYGTPSVDDGSSRPGNDDDHHDDNKPSG